MTSRHSPLAVTLILVLLSLRGGIALAQGGSDTDPRFEKLAKDLYPKAKQEGASGGLYDLGRRAHPIDLGRFQ